MQSFGNFGNEGQNLIQHIRKRKEIEKFESTNLNLTAVIPDRKSDPVTRIGVRTGTGFDPGYLNKVLKSSPDHFLNRNVNYGIRYLYLIRIGSL